jgi:hypothetical protein
MSISRIDAAPQGDSEVEGLNMVNNSGSGHTRNGRLSTLQAGHEYPYPVHPAWAAFMRFCGKLQHGEIECLRIQDGLPVLAEVTTKKVKFG